MTMKSEQDMLGKALTIVILYNGFEGEIQFYSLFHTKFEGPASTVYLSEGTEIGEKLNIAMHLEAEDGDGCISNVFPIELVGPETVFVNALLD